MAAPWIDPTLCLVVTLGIGGSALGLMGLLLPFPLRGVWKALPIGFASLAAGFCALAALLGQPATTWGPTLALLGIGVVFTVARTRTAQQVCVWVGRGARSARCQAAALLLLCPAFAIRCIPAEAEADSFDGIASAQTDSSILALPPREEVRPSPVQTDQGRSVPVHRSIGRLTFTPDFMAKQSAQLRAWQFSERVITVTLSDSDCNCHGWVFTGGRYWVASTEVPLILQDNGYQPTDAPQAGDVIVYQKDGVLVHTGIVRLANPETEVLVESKWGILGRFIHPPEIHPYGDCLWTYHRSPRRGHILRGLPGAPTSAAPSRHPDRLESAQQPAQKLAPFVGAAE